MVSLEHLLFLLTRLQMDGEPAAVLYLGVREVYFLILCHQLRPQKHMSIFLHQKKKERKKIEQTTNEVPLYETDEKNLLPSMVTRDERHADTTHRI